MKNFFRGGNEGFVCLNCQKTIAPSQTSTPRNHCPFCFFSLHVDENIPGDREASCQKLMKPIDFENKNNQWRVLHLCTSCGKEQWNKLLLNDSFQSDQLSFIQEFYQKKTYSNFS